MTYLESLQQMQKLRPTSCLDTTSYLLLQDAQVLQGKVWVWGEGGPRAFTDSAAVQPAYVPELAVEEGIRHASGAEAVTFSVPYTRDFPYAWDVLAENLLDPSHVNFSHHGVIGNRYGTFERNA